ncbi:hypothetical protein LCGC14_2345840, partial [marine sediment metagenome]
PRNVARRVYSMIPQLPDIRQQLRKLGVVVESLRKRLERSEEDDA